VKRAIVTVAALVVCALASAAGAQTQAQVAKYNRYLSKHPGAAQQFGANGATYNAAGYPGGYAGMQNYANTYSTQYQKNLATYENYMATHPGMAQLGAAGYGSPYGSYYPGAQNYLGAYPNQGQQLGANPLMAIVAPLLGSSAGLQNYMGNYGAAAPYAGSAYPMEPIGGGAGYGAYGAGPYGASGYGAAPYYAAGNPYQGGHFRYGHGRYMGGSTAFANPGGYFGRHNSGGAGRSQALAMGAAGSGPWHHHGHWGH